MRGHIKAIKRFWRRFARARHGGVAMMFAISLPVLVMTALVGVDVHRLSTVRANLQDALDAAALAAARSPHTDDVNIRRVGMAALRANLQAYPDIALREDLTEFDLTPDGVTVVASSRVDVDTLVANIVLPPYGQVMDDTMQVGVSSEVLRSATNLEVALVLDITGSMSGSKITDLQASANELITLLIQEKQVPYYSKAAIVPYSMGVNVGAYAARARGPVSDGRAITAADWMRGSPRSISGAARGNPVRITSNNHGFQNGDWVFITDVRGMAQINDRAFRVTNRSRDTFDLEGVSGWWYGNYSWGGTAVACERSDCSVRVTSPGHDFQNGSPVHITGVNGLTALNGNTYTVSDRSGDSYVLAGSNAQGQTYSSGGTAWCASQGCEYFAFRNAYNQPRTHRISTCVSERTGSQAYTDAAPSTAWIGRNYPTSANPCPSNTIVPLTSDRDTLTDAIDELRIGGSTAGHIGLAWGWYMLSPNFDALWTGSSRPAAYDAQNLLKVVVLMTDGEFNTVYCQSVLSSSSTSGSGSLSDQINCPAENGDAFAQADALCDAIKDEDIIIYTVGFALPNSGQVRDIMESCATDASHVFLPDSGADLREAFRAIARSISDLRIAR